MTEQAFYGTRLAALHHAEFGALAEGAARLLVDELTASSVRAGTVVDLGSGSGILARFVVAAGFDVVGVELSPAMVAIAEQVAPAATFRIASLLDVDIPPSVAVTAIGECLSYALADMPGSGALAGLFGRAAAALGPGGILLFDVATPGRAGPSGRRVVERRGDTWSLVMEAEERDGHETRHIELSTGRELVEETHRLRLLEPEMIRHLLEAAGFRVQRLEGYGSALFPAGVSGFLAIIDAFSRRTAPAL